MKYIAVTSGEFLSLKELAHRAKMDWFNEKSLTRNQRLSLNDIKDLLCAFQIENIELMTNVIVMNCYDVFVRAEVMDSVARTELFKLFKDRKVYMNGILQEEVNG